jgi:stearoyl-CoA desaturase (delta-9 desaturase)
MANQIKLILKNIVSQPNLWAGVIPMHVLGIAAIFNFPFTFGWWWVAFLIGYICIMMLGIGACYHRLLSHKGFTVNRPMKLFMLWCAAMGGQGSPIFWITVHRGYHHRLTDKPGDMHSPKDGFWHSYMLWMFKITELDLNPKYAIDILKDKDAMFFHKHYIKILVLSHLIVALICFPLWVYGLLLPSLATFHCFSMQTSLNHTRSMGYKNYLTDDDSVNSVWLWPITFGEAWHNNHHGEPKNPNFGGRNWWEIDPTYWLIQLVRTDKTVN